MKRSEAINGTYALDVLSPDDLEWLEFSAGNLIKPLRVGRDGSYAVLSIMKKGAHEPRHRHIGSMNVYVISGGGTNINGVMPGPGSWIYERDGAVHDAFVCAEDSMGLTIAGPGAEIELLDDDDNVIGRLTAAELLGALPEDLRKKVQQD